MFMRTLRESPFHTFSLIYVTSSHNVASILGEKGHQSLAFRGLQDNWEMMGHQRRGRGSLSPQTHKSLYRMDRIRFAQPPTEH